MVTIDGYDAARILAISDLIIKYRESLTDGNMNSKGGFPIKRTILNNGTPGIIRATFNEVDLGKKNLDVVHVGGQICGFISNPGTSARKFHFLNKTGNSTDSLNTDTIRTWYTSPTGYGGSPNDIIPYPGIDRRYEGCSAKDINLSLGAINNQINNLFFRSNGLSQELMRKSFYTFLLVCSEGAKNSLVHEQVITKLIAGAIDPRTNAYGPLSAPPNPKNDKDTHIAFVGTILTAAKNCGNGEINYVNQNTERQKIMENFGMRTFAGHANVVYQGNNLEQTYTNIIDSGNYQDCHRALGEKPLTGQTLNHANPQRQLAGQRRAQNRAQAANLPQPPMGQQIAQAAPPVPPEGSDLDLIVSCKYAALEYIEAQGSRPPSPLPDGDGEDIANLSDLFANEELGSSPNPGLDNDSTISPTNNGFEGPSPGNSQPLDKGNYDAKASLTEANIIKALEIEPNPEVPESSMKNDDPDDLGVKPNPGGSENSTENKLCDTITKKAALFKKNGVTKDDECLALVEKIKKKTAQALTAEAEATNTSVYTPTFKPGGL